MSIIKDCVKYGGSVDPEFGCPPGYRYMYGNCKRGTKLIPREKKCVGGRELYKGKCYLPCPENTTRVDDCACQENISNDPEITPEITPQITPQMEGSVGNYNKICIANKLIQSAITSNDTLTKEELDNLMNECSNNVETFGLQNISYLPHILGGITMLAIIMLIFYAFFQNKS